ncbi:organic cation transporter-like protein isoform X1 [Cotesia glomerata]|nr:organic cation transporter-like protein isoform X1 [Cotesia glomerata]XP_044583286.1 organic cation transporter-like protein isoform X1 [Cotesia glomerata]
MAENETKKVEEMCLLQILDKLGQGSKLLWIVFVVSIITSLVNGLHSMSYIFIAEIPEHWCSIPELQKSNWSAKQIKNIFQVDECHIYNFNYQDLADLKYEDAEKYVKDMKFNASVIPCTSFVFDKNGRSTIVNEWDLVCDKKLYRESIFFVYAFGRLLGNGFLGIYADKYGRKKALVIGLILQIIAVPSSALVPWYWAYMFFKLITGICVGAMYSSAYTLLSEVTVDTRRKVLGTTVDILYPVGTVTVLSIAYFITEWRYLQITLSLFTIPISILIWFIPESPRWLISQNYHVKAQKILDKYNEVSIKSSHTTANSTFLLQPQLEESTTSNNKEKKSIKQYFGSMNILFSDSILRRKILIMYFSFFVSILVGYCLIFSIDTFDTNRYIYMAITASTEILALLTVPVILLFLSCKRAAITIYWIASICMLLIIEIPRANINVIIGMTLLSKFFLSACCTTNMLLSSELFPPHVRNSAFGTSLVIAQIGTMSAPYVVGLLGGVAPWVPTCLYGTLTLIAGFICCFIPL